MLNSVWLNTFKTLIDTGHFTKAAEKLHMTQPGVSQQIRKLEEACGHQLVRRVKKRFEITEQGRDVYEYACQLERSEATLLDKLSTNHPYAGQYRIACSGSQALTLYPKLLELQQEFPKLIVTLEAAPNHKILIAIKNSDIDVGIVTSMPNRVHFDTELLGQESLCLVLPQKYADTANVFDALMELGLIRHPDIDHYLSLYMAKFGDETFSALKTDSFPVTGYVNQINQILLPISKGLGFTVLPKSAVDSFSHPETLAVFSPGKEVKETLYLVSKRHRVLPKRFNTVNDRLRKHFSADHSG
ncbi:LysR family transcriptional regulator [Photobacterium atrarenae]|uniref:LysR family transcriptional regulator n=1 Tax=Photobacterium atrarenae TaxID=865757 RepID=A0ABY5GNV0_9GAMM|nr:LysR family transcriptional regulator [Photobacterium atrarenae]UTV31027.1 LysR family transcriptional regulator [Photobacterium atrarenae]